MCLNLLQVLIACQFLRIRLVLGVLICGLYRQRVLCILGRDWSGGLNYRLLSLSQRHAGVEQSARICPLRCACFRQRHNGRIAGNNALHAPLYSIGVLQRNLLRIVTRRLLLRLLIAGRSGCAGQHVLLVAIGVLRQHVFNDSNHD